MTDTESTSTPLGISQAGPEEEDPDQEPYPAAEFYAGGFLHQIGKRMARRIYAEHGYAVPEDYDFSVATHPQERAAFRSVVGAIEVLGEFLLEAKGLSLFDLLDPDSSYPFEPDESPAKK